VRGKSKGIPYRANPGGRAVGVDQGCVVMYQEGVNSVGYRKRGKRGVDLNKKERGGGKSSDTREETATPQRGKVIRGVRGGDQKCNKKR